ncbi:endonuclease MutS2 [Clostridia bacterium]|nr:endonuclease MutS2 [Clostridia bacterium]
MNEKARHTLEFTKIRDMLGKYCVSERAKRCARELSPVTGKEDIEMLQEETEQAVSMILKNGTLPLGGIRDLSHIFARLRVRGVLQASDFTDISDFLYVCKKITGYFRDEARDEFFTGFDLLSDLFTRIQTLPELERAIARCIEPPDGIADSASANLGGIRRSIAQVNERIREQLNAIIRSSNYKTMLQENIITIRNDRFCVPVKQEYSSSFNGMIHDRSSTGSTVFIEPMSVVNQNNRLKELRADEKAEIEKILRELSELCAEDLEVLTGNYWVLTELDFIFAKGELSVSMGGVRPSLNDNGYVNIKKARHPLLDKNNVVPTDIYLGGDFTTLLITGPNTGGKTVTLKTVGLFTLMAQSGLQISASAVEVCELAVFDDVFADIGDEQSIEQSLSTFSSHMSNITDILSAVTPNSLVLLDELGAGTDPTEGAALAIAILEHLRKIGVRCAVTTHYSELKVYALSTLGVENAACEFSVETLRPTYKLLIGVPGKSNAFEISRRLGLSDEIIEDAKNTLSKEDIRLEDVITDLEISRRHAENERIATQNAREEAERLREQIEQSKENQTARSEKIISEAREKARQIYIDAKNEADALLKEYKQKLKDDKQNEVKKKLDERLGAFGSVDLLGNAGAKTANVYNFKKGDSVIVIPLDKPAVIAENPVNGEALVAIGSLKMKMSLNNLKKDKAKPKQQAAAFGGGKSSSVSAEVDLRGCTVEEGLSKCGKYLDDAYLSNISKVTIIHGKGTGVLRGAITAYLKTHPHIKSYRLGTFGEGEDGVTIAEFDK